VDVDCQNYVCYRAICTLIEEKVNGKQIGVIGDYPITVTSIGCPFLFRVVGLGETSPVTWGLRRQSQSSLVKVPSHKSPPNRKFGFNNQ
jgi:hypothetical protein